MAGAPDWNLYRSLLAVLDSGSLSGAARALGLAQPTIGRHIEALEDALGGGSLFTRSGSGLRPTRAALALATHARAMAVAAEALIRTATGDPDNISGVVRVTASQIVGAEVLPPLLRDFRETHPLVDIELALSNQMENLLRRDADIAVRMARPTQTGLLARRIGALRVSLHAHRAYLQKHGEPQTLDDLRRHTLIGFDRDAPPPSAVSGIDFEITPDLFALRTDSDLAQLAALRAGFGIGACPTLLARRDPNLVPILGDVFGFDMEVWVVMHEDLKGDRRMHRLFDHLAQGLKACLVGELC